MAETRQLCTFRVEGALLGVPVEEVQEILRHQGATPIPLAPREIEGLINLRGQIVPAIELRRCLGVEERARELLPANVIVRTDEGLVSLLVDEIGDVLQVEAECFEAPPENLAGAGRRLIAGVYKLPGDLLSLLDVRAVVACATAGPAPRYDGSRGSGSRAIENESGNGAVTEAAQDGGA